MSEIIEVDVRVMWVSPKSLLCAPAHLDENEVKDKDKKWIPKSMIEDPVDGSSHELDAILGGPVDADSGVGCVGPIRIPEWLAVDRGFV